MLPADNWAERKLSAIKNREQEDRDYLFITSCIGSIGEDINAMRENAQEITYRTMRKHCDLSAFAEEMGYDRRKDQGLTLKDDFHVAYYKSTYMGCPCYFLVHSAIEYIWVKVDEWIPARETLNFYSDPGHAWLEVPRYYLSRLGIEKEISTSSYRYLGMVYLEKHADAAKFINALRKRKSPIPPLKEVVQENTPIRQYPPYRV